MEYVIALAGFEPDSFAPGGLPAAEWSAFCVLDRDDSNVLTGGTDAGLWTARFSRGVKHLHARFADFLRYENSRGRTVILSLPPGFDAGGFVQAALAAAPEPLLVRDSDPRVLVHSTTADAWRQIEREGIVKSSSRLAAERRLRRTSSRTPTEVDLYLAKEPPEYPDYVMLGIGDSLSTELVAASHACGRLMADPDAPYEPGARLYFDNYALIRAGLAVRDGLHPMKVRDSLPLRPYLLAALTPTDIAPAAGTTVWTPRLFTEAANRVFASRIDP